MKMNSILWSAQDLLNDIYFLTIEHQMNELWRKFQMRDLNFSPNEKCIIAPKHSWGKLSFTKLNDWFLLYGGRHTLPFLLNAYMHNNLLWIYEKRVYKVLIYRIVLFDSKTIKLQSFGDAGCHCTCNTFTNGLQRKNRSSNLLELKWEERH